MNETSVKTNLARLRGWAPCGHRLVKDPPFGRCGAQTLIAGLIKTAVIAPWVLKGAIDRSAFSTYVRDVLIPDIEPGSVVVLDNLATHRNK